MPVRLSHIDSALFDALITLLAMLDVANNGNPLITKREVQLVITDMYLAVVLSVMCCY